MKDKFQYKPSVLNIGVLIWIFFCVSLLLVNPENISDESGSGVLEVFKLIGIGLIGIILDFIFQRFIQNRTLLKIAQIMILVVMFLFIFN